VTGYRAAAIDELPTLWDGFAKLAGVYERPAWAGGK
jgi:hypothetical protein